MIGLTYKLKIHLGINPTFLDVLKCALGVWSLPLRGVNYILVGRDLEWTRFGVALEN